MRRKTAIGLWVAVGACGGPSAAETLDARFRISEVQEVDARAPDLVERARRARRKALQSEDPDAAEDYQTLSRLWLEAAATEAKRLALERERLAVERAEREAFADARRDRIARDGIVAQVRRQRAAEVAAREAARALEFAEEDEVRRYRRYGGDHAEAHRQAADVLLERARLVLAAAVAMEAPQDVVAQAEAAVEVAARAANGTNAVRAADEALSSAYAALGRARSRSEGPSAEERGSLIAMATERGFATGELSRGLAIVVGAIFAGRSGRLTRAGRARLERLATVVAAHPHGPVVVEVAVGLVKRRIAELRARAVLGALEKAGVPPERLSFELEAAPSDNGDQGQAALRAVLPAYGPTSDTESQER